MSIGRSPVKLNEKVDELIHQRTQIRTGKPIWDWYFNSCSCLSCVVRFHENSTTASILCYLYSLISLASFVFLLPRPPEGNAPVTHSFTPSVAFSSRLSTLSPSDIRWIPEISTTDTSMSSHFRSVTSSDSKRENPIINANVKTRSERLDTMFRETTIGFPSFRIICNIAVHNRDSFHPSRRYWIFFAMHEMHFSSHCRGTESTTQPRRQLSYAERRRLKSRESLGSFWRLQIAYHQS